MIRQEAQGGAHSPTPAPAPPFFCCSRETSAPATPTWCQRPFTCSAPLSHPAYSTLSRPPFFETLCPELLRYFLYSPIVIANNPAINPKRSFTASLLPLASKLQTSIPGSSAFTSLVSSSFTSTALSSGPDTLLEMFDSLLNMAFSLSFGHLI